MKANRHLPLILSTISLVFLLNLSSVLACPLCKEALFDPAQAKQTAGTAKGYAVSISLLLGMPVLLIGGVALALLRGRRLTQARRVDTRKRSA